MARNGQAVKECLIDISLSNHKENASSSLNYKKLLLSICSLLSDPNPDDPLEPDVAHLYVDNRVEFDITARDWVNKYAV